MALQDNCPIMLMEWLPELVAHHAALQTQPRLVPIMLEARTLADDVTRSAEHSDHVMAYRNASPT